MTKRDQVYKCEVCGNIVEVVHAGDGELTCCGKPMKLFIENTVDAAKEKHIPVAKKSGDGIIVQVGSVAHPMEEKHYIEWIELIYPDGTSEKKFLKPGDKPEAYFYTSGINAVVREYCNIHGLWKA